MSAARRPSLRPVPGPFRGPRARAGVLVALLLVPGLAALPRHGGGANAPAAPPAPESVRFLTPDSVSVSGTWYPAAGPGPSLVVAPRQRGEEPGLRQVAVEFQKRGFHTLVFDLRDPPPASRESDSLRYAVIPARWVNDVVGAFREARARAADTGHVFAWGTGLGGSMVVAAAARERGLCDALAAEDIFPNVDYELRRNGTSVIPEAVQDQRRFTNWVDEPASAASRLNMPVYAVLLGPEAGTREDPIQKALRRNRGRTDRWLRPGVLSPAPLPGPAQVDTLSLWFRRWLAFPPVGSGTGAN